MISSTHLNELVSLQGALANLKGSMHMLKDTQEFMSKADVDQSKLAPVFRGLGETLDTIDARIKHIRDQNGL